MASNSVEPVLLRTALSARHETLQARMVPFAGWLMPIQYSGVIAEHLHTRSAAGLFDLSHMGRLHVTGPDAVALLQRATTNDVERIPFGGVQYTLMCNEQGGVREDLLVYRCDDDWRLVVNASNRIVVLAALESLRQDYHLTTDVRDATFETALIGIQGPVSAAVLEPLVVGGLTGLGYYRSRDGRAQLPDGQNLPVMISRTGYTGEYGFEVIVPSAAAEVVWDALLADPRVSPIGLGARDTLRLEAGMALYGHELTENVTPYEAGLERVVRLEKGDFVGRDALVKMGEVPARRLVGLTFGPGAVPRAGFAVTRDGVVIGEVVSGTFSPTLRHPIATAYVEAALAEPGTRVAVTVRADEVPAEVVRLPFVPHRAKFGSAS